MRLDRHWIASQIPHQGLMHLLDSVSQWDENEIVCIASSHRSKNLPLRQHGRLGAVCGVEYAAQAMAVHGALLSTTKNEGSRPAPGYLISVRDVYLKVSRLDDIAGNLTITAQKIAENGALLYQFVVSSQESKLLHGRAAILQSIELSCASCLVPVDGRFSV